MLAMLPQSIADWTSLLLQLLPSTSPSSSRDATYSKEAIKSQMLVFVSGDNHDCMPGIASSSQHVDVNQQQAALSQPLCGFKVLHSTSLGLPQAVYIAPEKDPWNGQRTRPPRKMRLRSTA